MYLEQLPYLYASEETQMNLLNPNDPVITAMKDIVQAYEKRILAHEKDLQEVDGKLDAFAAGMDQAFKMVTQKNMELFSGILSRLASLEARVAAVTPSPASSDPPNGDGGREL